MYTKIISIQAYIFNSSEDCRLCKNSVVMHLLKIAWRMLSWWTYENIANESAKPALSRAFLPTRRQYSALLLSQDRCCFFHSLFLYVVNVRVCARWYTYSMLLYEYNDCSEIMQLPWFSQTSRADLYLLQLQDIEPCIMGHCLGHLGFWEGDVFREILIKRKACTVIKASALLFVQFCIKANNYSRFSHTIFI